MERYHLYKATSMQWLREIPNHWEERKISSIFRERREKVSDKDYAPLSVSKQGVTPQLETAVKTENGDNRKLVLAGDFVVNSRSDRKGSCGVSQLDGSVSLINIVLEPSTDINKMYFHHLARSNDYIEEYYRLGRGIVADLWTTRYSELKGMMIPLPPLVEQEKIVSYLESKTLKIDAYVEDKEKEILLLQELKQKEIAEAVTKGLNPNVKVKDSDISWIGMIPEHWELRRLSQVSYEHFISNKTVHHQNLLSLSYGRIIRKDINKTDGLLPASFDTYQIVEDGNIVLRLTDLQNDQKSLRVGLAKEEGIVTSAYVCLGVFDTMLPAYLYNVLHSFDIKKLFYSMGGGIRQGLNWQGLKKIDIPLPPLDEQRAIVAYIEEKCQKVDTLITELQAEIDYLKEYKQRLIADVVTGQVNVQNKI